MALTSDIVRRVRSQIGDLAEPFRTSAQGDGATTWFDLPVKNVAADGTLHVFLITGSSIGADLASSAYTLDLVNGEITMAVAPAANQVLMITGTSFGLFSDAELNQWVVDAFNQHTINRTMRTRYKDSSGFIKYGEVPMTLDVLPVVEEPMVAYLATTEALWALMTDASTDIDVSTSEGTHLARSQRYQQLASMVEVMEAKYKELAAQLNVGLWRIEVGTLRRVSMQTGRLVPIFVSHEYDDSARPQRLLPPIDHTNDDDSGIPSPLYTNGWL